METNRWRAYMHIKYSPKGTLLELRTLLLFLSRDSCHVSPLTGVLIDPQVMKKESDSDRNTSDEQPTPLVPKHERGTVPLEISIVETTEVR